MTELPKSMHAVQLTGHGGFEKLQYSTNVPVPTPSAGEVLIRVGAAGMNNTDINTRIGWYSKSVTSGSNAGADDGYGDSVDDDGGWAGVGLNFPLIQGADAAGTIVAVGDGVDTGRIGDRVMVRTMQTAGVSDPDVETETYGSERNGGFAQFCVAHESEAFTVNSAMSDVELASFPCAYSTAEGVLHRAEVTAGERVLITGASGGVGSATIQLAKARGAHVIAVAAEHKWPDLEPFGPDELIDRNADLVDVVGEESVDVVIDVVAGDRWPDLLTVLKRHGRYGTVGAIAGPIVELDVRTLYLKDLTLLGCTWQPRVVFENLVGYIERGEIQPFVANTYPLDEIVEAQKDFLSKKYAGKLVLIPPPSD